PPPFPYTTLFRSDDTTRHEQRHQQQQKQGLVERKRDDPCDHARLSVLRLEEGMEEQHAMGDDALALVHATLHDDRILHGTAKLYRALAEAPRGLLDKDDRLGPLRQDRTGRHDWHRVWGERPHFD